MQAISYPLRLVNGDLALDYTDTEIIQSELLAIIDTRLGDRLYRQSYGSKQYILKELDLSQILTDISVALETNLSALGFSAISVDLDSDLPDLQSGLLDLVIRYSLNASELTTSYSLQIAQ